MKREDFREWELEGMSQIGMMIDRQVSDTINEAISIIFSDGDTDVYCGTCESGIDRNRPGLFNIQREGMGELMTFDLADVIDREIRFTEKEDCDSLYAVADKLRELADKIYTAELRNP